MSVERPDPLGDLLRELDEEHASVDRTGWPPGVQEVSMGDLSRFGMDAEKRLYFDGKPVEVRRRLDLSKGERWFAIVVGLFTIFGSLAAVAQGWAAGHQWACQIELMSWHCPKK